MNEKPDLIPEQDYELEKLIDELFEEIEKSKSEESDFIPIPQHIFERFNKLKEKIDESK